MNGFDLLRVQKTMVRLVRPNMPLSVGAGPSHH